MAVLAAAALAGLTTAVGAACLTPTLPETRIGADGAGWCVTGSMKSNSEPRVTFRLAAAGLWRVALDVLPGQVGLALLTSEASSGARQLWQDSSPRAVGSVASPLLFLAEGPYAVAVATADSSAVYRLRLEPGPELPPGLGGPVGDAFTALVHGTDSQIGVEWTVGETPPNQLWTVSAQVAPGLAITLTLLDAAGNSILYTASPDEAGVFRLPDLQLAAGAYRLLLGGLPAGTSALLRAVTEDRGADFAIEPDAELAQAHPLQPSHPIAGRLATNGVFGERDTFAFTVPADAGPRRYDVALTAPSAAPLSLALVNADGGVIVQRDGARKVDLRALVLKPGRHILQVSGALPADVSYSLVVEPSGPPAAGMEIEPNDMPVAATPLPASGLIAGSFDGDDRDYLDLSVTGELELWEIEAIGDGITSLNLYDGRGQVIATAAPTTKNPNIRFSHLLLPPGHNVLRLTGTSGTWLLRANPIGPPVDGEEIEPDDDATRAQVLVAGRAQRGRLDRSDDRDLYAFHLAAPHRVSISLDAPADFAVQARLSWGDTRDRIAEPTSAGAAGEAQRLRWEGLLPPGDYFVELMAVGGISREAYTLTLDVPSFFDRPLDLEPNDAPWQAMPLPIGRQLVGVIQGDADADWYALDPAFGPGPVTVRAATMGPSLSLRLAKGDPAAPETIQQIDLYQAGDSATLDLPQGEHLLLRITGTAGPYAIDVGAPGIPAIAPVDAVLSFEQNPVAAYERAAQRLTGALSLRNTGPEPLTLLTSAWLGDERWRLTGLPEAIVLAPAGVATFPVALEIAADARNDFPVYAEIGLLAGGGAPVTARVLVPVGTGVEPVRPHRFEPFPKAMLGGLNVALSALGASVDDPAMAGLFDDVTDVNGVGLGLATPPPTVRLAGEGEVPIVGVILSLPPSISPNERLADFAVEVSRDGVNFKRVLTARLSALAREQAFLLPEGTRARAVRLIPLSAQGGPPIDRPRLAEFGVIAAPDFVLQRDGFDIALPVLGGHVVRAKGFGAQALTGEGAAWPGERPVIIPADRIVTPEWVLGFLDGRSARIAALTWHEREDTPAEQRIREVEVLAGPDGPLGPWVSVGHWRLDADPTPTLTLPEPVWARALSFRVIDPPAGALALPERIEVRESLGPSIMGAWGDLNHDGPYEAQAQPLPDAAPLPTISRDPLAPTALSLGTEARGAVKLGLVESWYALDLPENTRSLRAAFSGAVAPEVALTLVRADGREVALEPDAGTPGTLIAEVETAGPWRLRVTQPRASVAIAWDTSASVSELYPAIARMTRQLAWQLDPSREEINLVPFRGESSRFLMPSWSGTAADVYAALHAYPFDDSSSDAENALLFSASQLADVVGRRAVVLITDASYSGVFANEPLWASLKSAHAGVFALYLPADAEPLRTRAQTNLMTDWAGAAGGHVSRFASQGDSETAFRRVQAWLDRPASFAFTLAADTTPPPPGRLLVQLGDKGTLPTAGQPAAASPVAMEVILDASGSMLQRLGGSRRIDVAKDALSELGHSALPDGLPVALRVFGHDRPDSCESELFVPLGPLNREAFVAAVDRVQSINRARTSIAATLQQAGRDLAGVAAPIIVLVTDGEETCGGDPLAEIERMRAAGIDVKLNIVGFAIGDQTTRHVLESWAKAAGGSYFDAVDKAALGAAAIAATALSYSVLDEAGTQVAQGVVGGEAVELPPGRYVVHIGPSDFERAVVVKTGETQTVSAW